MELGIGHEFVERTKHRYLSPSNQQLGASPPPIEATFDIGGPLFALPKPGAIETPLRKVIDGRTSVRSYAQAPLSRDELAYLLWCTQGVKSVDYGHTFRTVPSAGARHAIETIVLANRVEGIQPSAYRYRALEHALQEYIASETIADEVTYACLQQTFVKRSAAVFIWVAIVARMTWRYEQRGYRYLFLDVGHVCQNLYLAAESIGCGVCSIAAFDDDKMNELLKLDGKEKFVIYLATVGKRES